MIQGGGFDSEFKQLQTRAPIRNEADRGGENDRGSIAMARTSDPHSATAQFFINVVDNDFLNHRNQTTQGWGYTAFGRVVEGMDTVDSIAAVQPAPAECSRTCPRTRSSSRRPASTRIVRAAADRARPRPPIRLDPRRHERPEP